MKPEALDEKLLQLVTQHDSHLWVGTYPPFDFVAVDFWNKENLRLSASHHQQYEVVWAYEHDLAALPPGKYELVLDEMLRLLGTSGKLVLRYSMNEYFTNIRLKHFLGRRFNARISIDDEWQEDGVFTTVFHVERMQLDEYRSDDWTFALITVGTRDDNVLAFLESVRSADPQSRHEILICGPENEKYAPYNVVYLPEPERPYRNHLAEISRKKNDIADFATKTNLLIAHDRYRLDDNFFAGFKRYGYDFDFVSILQWYECGKRFPAYVAMEGPPLTWQVPIDHTDYSRIEETQFLNGGLLIAKTKTLRTVRFNELHFWNQAEDLELSHSFRKFGIPPRINCFSSATTIGITTEHTATFRTMGSEPLNSQDYPSQRKGWIPSIRRFGRRFERKFRPVLQSFKRRAS